MPSFQDSGPGSKSSKITGLNPFTPFFAQPGDLDEQDDVGPSLTEDIDRRLRLDKPREETNQQFGSQPKGQAPTTSATQQQERQQVQPAPYERNEKEKKSKEDDSDDDSDFDSDFDDDPVLDAIRQKRLAELKRAQIQKVENKAKGHGDYRTITQDEFLPECTGSEFVAIHFFHKEFERCKIMDHHLKKICPLHLSCKFLRIDAEKAPFFVGKLNIKALPTLLMFRHGKAVDRLTGFEGLSDINNPDEFPTSRLGIWLEHTGAIEYEGPDTDDEEEEAKEGSRARLLQSRFRDYDEDI